MGKVPQMMGKVHKVLGRVPKVPNEHLRDRSL